jgi:hypothetical protein
MNDGSQSDVDAKKSLLALWPNAKDSCIAHAIMAEITKLMGDLPAAAAGNVCSGTWTGLARSRETSLG